jgi:hypothetical protein
MNWWMDFDYKLRHVYSSLAYEREKSKNSRDVQQERYATGCIPCFPLNNSSFNWLCLPINYLVIVAGNIPKFLILFSLGGIIAYFNAPSIHFMSF